jgi:hypothetical protein
MMAFTYTPQRSQPLEGEASHSDALRRHSMKTMIPVLLGFALAASSAAAADDVYRSVMPDGSVRYGESPAPGAKTVRKVPPPPASTGTITVTPEEKQRRFDSPTPAPAAVFSQPVRPAVPPAQSGTLQAPSGLPQRSY